MSTIRISQGRLRLSRRLHTHQAPELHSFFGEAFEDEVRRHSYGEDGRPLYEYPRIQFKVIDSTAVLLGIGESSGVVRRLWSSLDENELGDEHVQVLGAQLETGQAEITACTEPIEYRFVTPWLALNQKNFRSYTGSRNTKFRKDELSRILVGNCLGLAKSLDIAFGERIDADCRTLTSIKTTLNGKGVIGFLGRFKINLKLPDYLGLGKSVARGFGAIMGES